MSKWTQTPPTQPGLYFIRDDEGVSVVEVDRFTTDGKLLVTYIGNEMVFLLEDTHETWWPDPITPPPSEEA